MYSYEDYFQAFRLYLTLGKRIKATVRQFWVTRHAIRAHGHTFIAWGGIPRRGIYDNMKTAVDRIRPGNVREVSEMVSYYLF
ncbi:hypothetical protein PXJ20_26335 [Paraburkholderia sp. A1RI_3L]